MLFDGIEQFVCTCTGLWLVLLLKSLVCCVLVFFSLLCTCFFRKLKHNINGFILLPQVHLQSLESKISDAERLAILKARLREEGIHCGDGLPGQYGHTLCPRVALLLSFFYDLVLLVNFLSLTFLLHAIWNV